MPKQPSDSNLDEVKVRTQREQSHYASNFRSFLTGLVVLHHTAVSYGGEGGHMFRSGQHPPGSSAALVGFNALNQSFFMGSFFFLAGHYSKKSLQHKPTREFIKGRLYRLALPTAIYTIIAPPLCQAIVQLARGQNLSWMSLKDNLMSIQGVRGPVWFTALLLLFDLGLATAESRASTGSHDERTQSSERQLKKSQQIFGVQDGIALCSVVEFLWRTKFPVNRMFRPLNMNLGYFPQYVFAYWFGTRVASPREAILTTSANLRLLAVSMLSGGVLISAFQQQGGAALQEMLGGFGLSSAAYAVWNNTTGYLLGNSLLGFFATYGTADWGCINAYAFAAFLVHIPASVLIQSLADDWKATGVIKTAIIGPLNIVASWTLGYCASKLWGKFSTLVKTV